MAEPVRPVSSKTKAAASQPKAQPQEPKKVKIGNVEFRKDQIIEDKTKTYMKDGKKMNTVFVKPGVQIDFPDQNPKKGANVNSIGLRSEWYNPDSSNIHIYNLDGATIYGISNKSDYINLEGISSNNTVIVDQKESWYIDGSQRSDTVDLGPMTSNNTVKMDEKDTTDIFYNRPEVRFDNRLVQSDLGILHVQGEGTSEQELQLKESIKSYDQHKHQQEFYKKRTGQ